MNIGAITCCYYLRIYNYDKPADFSWPAMCDKWRAEFHWDDFLKLAGEIADIGFDAIEIWEPTFSYRNYTLDDARALSMKLAELGIHKIVYCIGGWSAKDADEVEKAYQFARELTARTVTGCIIQPDADIILPVIEAAGLKYNIRYAIENHPKPNFEAPIDIANAIKPYKTIGANIDTGLYNSQGYDVLDAINTMGDRIYHVHLKDTMRGEFECLPIGQGNANLGEAIKRLAADGYANILSVEMEYPTDPTPGLAQSLAFIKSQLE